METRFVVGREGVGVDEVEERKSRPKFRWREKT